MLSLLALLLAAPCPPQRLPAADFAGREALQYKLDAMGADVGSFEIRAEPPPSGERPRAAVLLSSRAKTSAFVSTNLARFETYSTSLIAPDFSPLRYREDVDENDLHHGTELTFPPQNGTLVVKATRNGEPVPLTLQADEGVRDMISTLFLLRRLSLHQRICLEVFAGRKVWKLTGQMAERETIETPIGRLPALRFDGDAVRLDDERVKRTAHVWISDDARRLPLVAIGEVKGKTIRAQLISAPGGRRAARK
jgi:hypothetical protein